MLRFYREVRAIRGEHQFEGFAIQPDAGTCWGRLVGRKRDGTPVDLEFADCYRFEEGFLRQRQSYFHGPLV